MALGHRWIDRSLTRLELIMALLILLALAGIFIRYMTIIFARAEKAMVDMTVTNINTVLNYQASLSLINNGTDNLLVFPDMNPMENMQAGSITASLAGKGHDYLHILAAENVSRPVNYAGVIAAYDEALMEKGKWYYQLDEKLLIYTLRNSVFFESDINGMPRLRFRIAVEYEDKNANGLFEQDADQFKSLNLKPVDDYIWNI